MLKEIKMYTIRNQEGWIYDRKQKSFVPNTKDEWNTNNKTAAIAKLAEIAEYETTYNIVEFSFYARIAEAPIGDEHDFDGMPDSY